MHTPGKSRASRGSSSGHTNGLNTSTARSSTIAYRHNPLIVSSIDSVERRNSMSIQSILNPTASDRACDSRTPSLSPLFTARAPELPTATHRLTTTVQEPTPYDTGDDHSSRASSVPARARAFRPAYDIEESHFIWYHRSDLEMTWVNVEAAFNEMWPGDRRRKGGLQCKLYRFLDSIGLPRARQMKQSPGERRRYGMLANTQQWYPWMDTRGDRLHGRYDRNNM